MKESLRKLTLWVALVIAIIGSLCTIVFALDQQKVPELQKFNGLFDLAYGIILAFVVICLLAMVYFVVIRIIKGKGKGLLIGMGLVVVVCVIGYLLSSGTDISQTFLEKNAATESTSKIVGAGCIITYVMIVVSVLAIIYVECAQLFKKK